MRLPEADLAREWMLKSLATELHTAPRLFGSALQRRHRATAHGLPQPAPRQARRRLLLHSDEPVTSIGRAVGWPDQSGFARRFKAHYGLSATTYRKRFATGAAHLYHPAAAASEDMSGSAQQMASR